MKILSLLILCLVLCGTVVAGEECQFQCPVAKAAFCLKPQAVTVKTTEVVKATPRQEVVKSLDLV